MDRDVYLILVGAGISLASSIATLLLQFFLGLIRDALERKRQEAKRQRDEIRAELTRKDTPIYISGPTFPIIKAPVLERPASFIFLGREFIVHSSAIRFAAFVGIVVFIVQVAKIFEK